LRIYRKKRALLSVKKELKLHEGNGAAQNEELIRVLRTPDRNCRSAAVMFIAAGAMFVS
jgi:hypothetical protein